MSVTTLQDYDEYVTALKNAGSKLMVLDFFAEWCGPCKRLSPILQKLAKDHTNMLFFKINVDNHDILTKEYDICSMPTIIFLKNGLVAKKIVGVNIDGIKETLMEFETFSSENLCLGC